MRTKTLTWRVAARRLCGLVAVMAAASGCGLDKAAAPSEIGPSGHALSMILSASPSVLPRDGSSQATITILARDAAGQPWGGVRLLASVSPSSAQLVNADVVTNPSGQAVFAVVAPPASAVAANNQIVVSVVPVDGAIGNNFDNVSARSLAIGLLGPANATAPTPDFIVTPDQPAVGRVAIFDASATTDEGVACDTCSFQWDFGANGSATGRIVAKTFTLAGDFAVTLTVTDTAGTSATIVRSVTVTAPGAPDAAFVFSPQDPVANQNVFFDASTSTVGEGATIVNYEWSFGDGGTATGRQVSHPYGAMGTYQVVLTITDSLGRTDSISQAVDVD